MRAAAILLAAGRGERLGEETPKAFVDLGGRSLLAHAVDAVVTCTAVDLVLVAVPPGFEERAMEHVAPLGDRARVIVGGATRQGSVAAALDIIAKGDGSFDTVVVHDVARPLANPALFDAVLAGLADADGAVPGIPVADTIKRIRDGVVTETLRRDELVAVQTPQAFRKAALERAHAEARRDAVEATDDAALLERIGSSVLVIPGDPRNIKVTVPEDLAVASLLVGSG